MLVPVFKKFAIEHLLSSSRGAGRAVRSYRVDSNTHRGQGMVTTIGEPVYKES